MDPLTALGVVANVLQIVQLGSSFASTAYRIYKSSDGALANNIDLESTACSLRALLSRLDATLNDGKATCFNQGDQALKDVCQECGHVGDAMIQLLRTLKIDNTSPRKWASVKKAFQGHWIEKEIKILVNRFALCRERLEFHMLEYLT